MGNYLESGDNMRYNTKHILFKGIQKMKKLSALFLAAILAVLAVGCGGASDTAVVDVTTMADEQVELTTVEAVVQTLPSGETIPTPEGATSEATTQSAPVTVAEIVTLFNTGANKIKTNATKVVKNYEKRTVNNDKLVVPSSLKSTAQKMISTFMKDDTEPIVYSTRAQIKSEYLVPEQSYVSKLDPAYVVSATCTDTGKEYKIVIKLKNQNNPKAGSGIGAVCDVIESSEVAEKAPFVEEFSTEYYNCVIKATIDKATGRMIKTNYVTPVVLKIKVNMFGKHDVAIGFTFEKDYTITY